MGGNFGGAGFFGWGGGIFRGPPIRPDAQPAGLENSTRPTRRPVATLRKAWPEGSGRLQRSRHEAIRPERTEDLRTASAPEQGVRRGLGPTTPLRRRHFRPAP